MPNGRPSWLKRLFRSQKPTLPVRRAPRLGIESLEGRVVPAITILDAASGGTLDADLQADGIVSAADGTISRGALTAVPANTNISITSTAGDITFNNFAAAVTLLTGGGSSASFITTSGNITFADPTDNFSTSGGGLVFTAAGGTSGLTLAALTGSSLSATAPGSVAVRSMTSTGAVTATSTAGSVTSTNALQTPAQLTLSARTGINVVTSAATLQATISAGAAADIVVQQTATPSQLLTITNTAGGVVNNSTGGNISITNLGSGIALAPSAIVQSNGGNITLTAQDFIIDATASINANNGGGAGGGVVTLGATAGALVDLGTNTNGRLSLTQAELNRVTGSLLRVGSNVSGAFEVTAAITGQASFNNTLALISGAAMTDAAAGSVTATNLRLSGTGPITLDSANNVQNLVADLTGTPAGALLFSNGTNLLTVGANIDGVTGITSANGNVTLVADNLDVANTVNVGNGAMGGIVTLQPFTASVNVDLGSAVDTNPPLELSNAELNQVTARVLRVESTGTADILLNQLITLGANVPTLSLISAGDIDSVGLGGLVVTNLRVSAGAAATSGVFLTSTTNDVDSVAGGAAGGILFVFNDLDGFVIDTVDTVAGVSVNAGAATNFIDLNAGAAVTQTAGANVTGPRLLLRGAGPYTLTEAGNDVDLIAATLTGAGNALTYTDADDLSVNAVAGSVGTTNGITTNNGAVTLRVANGTVGAGLVVANTAAAVDLNAGTAAVTLTSEGLDGQLSIAGDVAGGSALFTADRMGLDGDGANTDITITNTATLRPFTAARLIGLDNTAGDPTGVLRFSDGELDNVAAAVIVIGRNDMGNAAGDITVASAIDTANTNQLELVTAGTISGAGSITEGALGLTAGTGIATEANPLDTVVSNVEATTATGGIYLANTTTALTVGGVNGTLTGITVTGTPASNISVTNDASIVVGATATEGVSNASGGDIIFSASGAASNVAVNAPLSATGGNGSIAVFADNDITVAGNVSVVGMGTITIDADAEDNGTGTFTSTTGTLTTAGGDIEITAADATVGAAVSTTTAATSRVAFLGSTAAVAFNLGTNTAFGLTNTELGFVTTGTVQVGDATNTGGIALTGTVNLAPAQVPVLRLQTAGAVTDGTAGEVQDDLFVQSLAITAATGVGSGDAINVAVTNLAVSNATSGNVSISNRQFSAAGPLNLTAVDGVTGVSNAGPGNIDVSHFGGTLSVLEAVTATGGGNILLATGGAAGDLTVTNNGSVVASGGNGTISLDTSAATSGGQITVNDNTTAGVEVSAAGTGTITLNARAGVELAGLVVIQSGDNAAGGAITVNANAGNPTGTADIVLGESSAIFTRDNVTLNADPNGSGAAGGGAITMQNSSRIAGPTNTRAAAVVFDAGEDVRVTRVLATSIDIETSAALIDDGVDGGPSVLDASTTIALTAGGRIGGNIPLTTDDVLSASTANPTANYLAAIDVAYGTTLTLDQVNTLGNVQVRKIDAGLNLSSVTVVAPLVAAGNQLALISAGGNLTVDTGFAFDNGNLFLATAGATNNNIVFNNAGSVANNLAGASTTLLASGSTTAAITAPPVTGNDGTADVAGSNLTLATSGGGIGTLALPLEIDAREGNLSGFTNGAVDGDTPAGGDAFLTDTLNGIRVGQFNAGTAGDVTLVSVGNIAPTGSAIISASPNDNVAEIIADVVTLTAAGATTGDGGQIGFFTTAAQFFEVDVNQLNATTTNSRAWISALNGTQLGTAAGVNVGTNTAVLRTVNGNLTSSAASAADPDVVAGQGVVLIGDNGGFGATGALGALQLDTPTVTADITAGTGDMFLQGNRAAGLTVNSAKTVGGSVDVRTTTGPLTVGSAAALGNVVNATAAVLLSAGAGNLTIGTATSTGTQVVATGTATLTSVAGQITSLAPAGVNDVQAASAALSAATGIGTGGGLETALGTLAASSPTGGVNLTNTGALTIGAVGAVTGITAATSGDIVITATSPLTVAENVTGAALVTLTAGDTAGTGDDLTVNASRTVSTTNATANAVTLNGGDAVVINGTVTTGAGGTVNVTVDQGATDAGAGGTVTVAAVASVTGATALNILGGADPDTFNLRALANVATDLDGGAGSDTLNVDLTGATTRTLAVDGLNAGVLVLSAPNDIDYTGVEFVNTTNGTYALTLNLNTAGFQNGSAQPDVTTAAATGGGANLSITVGDGGGAPVAVFGGEIADVSALNLIGSTDRDTFVLNLGSGNLPAVDVTGNAPTAAPGDTLNLTTGGAVTGTTFTPGAAGAGTYTFTNRNAVTFTGIETLPAPIVTVAATDATAAETGANEPANTGTFTFTRIGDTSAALTVNFTLGGTAVAGRDFQALGTAVTFAAGSATATVTLAPLNNSLLDGTRTAVLTLVAGTGYEIGAGAAGTVTIADNDRPVRRFAVGSSAGGAVQVFDDASQVPTFSFLPYAGYTGGVSVAVADLTGDGVLDFVTGATELSSHVKAFDGRTGAEILSFFAFAGFNAGVGVAAGDLDGDGRAEIIVGALTSAPHVKAFRASGAEVASFFAFTVAGGAPVANLGVSVAAGDFNGDGRAEILVGSRSQAAHVKTFDLVGNEVSESRSFLAPQLSPGISVGAGDLNGDGIAEILVGGVGNGLNTALVINPSTLAVQRTIQQGTAAAAPAVAAADLDGDGDEELLLSLGSQFAAFDGRTFEQLAILNPFVGFRGNVFVG